MENTDSRRCGSRTSLLLAVTAVLLIGCAQGGSRSSAQTGQSSGAGYGGNTITGGAEAAPTDQATPRGPQGGAASAPSSGGGNTLTGGAEAAPTDQATPRGTGVKP